MERGIHDSSLVLTWSSSADHGLWLEHWRFLRRSGRPCAKPPCGLRARHAVSFHGLLVSVAEMQEFCEEIFKCASHSGILPTYPTLGPHCSFQRASQPRSSAACVGSGAKGRHTLSLCSSAPYPGDTGPPHAPTWSSHVHLITQEGQKDSACPLGTLSATLFFAFGQKGPGRAASPSAPWGSCPGLGCVAQAVDVWFQALGAHSLPPDHGCLRPCRLAGSFPPEMRRTELSLTWGQGTEASVDVGLVSA